MAAEGIKVVLSGPLLSSIVHECSGQNLQGPVHGILYGKYYTKRSIGVSDSDDNEVSMERKALISHYLCTYGCRPAFDDMASSDCQGQDSECIGMFVVRKDATIFPSFRDIVAICNAGNYKSFSDFPLVCLVVSVPNADSESPDDSDWIYSIKYKCFSVDQKCNGGPILSEATIDIPSLGPDVATHSSCLHRSGVGMYTPQVSSMASAGISQAVESEFFSLEILDAIKKELHEVYLLEKEISQFHERNHNSER